MSTPDDILKSFLDADDDEGFGLDELLERGVYPFEIVKIQRTAISERTGTFMPTLQLRVIDGPQTNRVAFVTQALVNPFDSDRRNTKFHAMSKGFMTAIGATPQAVDPDVEDAVEDFYNAESWEGARFIGELDIETAEKQKKAAEKADREVDAADLRDRNRLVGWHRWSGGSFDYERWKTEVLPKQQRAAERKTGVGTDKKQSVAKW